MTIDIRRREFISALFGGAAIWPLAAHAQQGERMRRIGVLMSTSADDMEGKARLAAFLQGLQEAGWAVGRNLGIDLRWGGGDAHRVHRYAAELVALAPDVILASGLAYVAVRPSDHQTNKTIFVTEAAGWARKIEARRLCGRRAISTKVLGIRTQPADSR